ncbi:hypothetical protein [Mesorhizobium sp. LjNodule214]|uniref:hypothetical protein n=1 Tax=Mesorhizobium sp. LjNodule214 TaxID=3342252 RepID=UPI003ECDDCCA
MSAGSVNASVQAGNGAKGEGSTLNDAVRMRNMRLPGSKISDVADFLPSEARARLVALREEKDDLLATTRATSEAYQEAIKAKREASNLVNVLTEHSVAIRVGYDRIYPEDHNLVIEARQTLTKATDEFARITEKRDARSHRWQQVAHLVQAVERYLASVSAPFSSFTGKTEKKPASLDAARKTIATLLADRQEVQAAPIPSTKVRQSVRAEIDALAEKGRPALFAAIEYGEAIGWPKQDLPIESVALMVNDEARTPVIGRAHAEGPNTLALFAWLHRDALIEALDKEITEVSDDGAALDDETRAKKLGQIADDLLDAERAECALIEASGDRTAYRVDTDPRALLAIVGPAPRAD